MRLICPNCDAQYEVPDAVVPTEGRDVQCSECGQTWFQNHPSHPPIEEEEELHESDIDEAPQTAASRTVDENIQEILRQEAELETAARARDSAALESQPDLGLDEEDSARRSRESRERMARIRGKDAVDQEAEAAAVAAAAGSRRDLLPDIDEINSTLRSTSDRRSTAAQMQDIDPKVLEGRGRGGFWGGFIIIVVLVAVLFGIYVYAPQIARAVPAADPYLNTYVTSVDNGRVWLDARFNDLLAWLEKTAASQE